MADSKRNDPSLVRNQPALRTSDGGIWLIWGAVSVVIVGIVMGFMAALEPALGWTGLVVVVLLFVAMLVARFLIRPRHPRLITLAVLQLLMVLVGLACVLTVIVVEAR